MAQKRETWLARTVELHSHQTEQEERLNSISHYIGAALVLPYIFFVAIYRRESAIQGALLVHGCTLVLLYLASAIYHHLPFTDAKRVLRLCDHSAIYVLIAGTYTPVLAITEHSTPLLVLIWSLALIGILFSLLFWGRFKILHVLTYLAMGWVIVPVWNLVVPALPPGLLKYVVSAGVTYTLGVILYASKSISFGHFWWHVACMVAGLLFSVGFAIHLY